MSYDILHDMANMNRSRESIDTIGLLVVKHTIGLTPQGRAADAAGFPTSAADEGPVEELFEICEGLSPASIAASMRTGAAEFRRYDVELSSVAVAKVLEHWAKAVDAIGETVGELLARTGLDEGDSVEIRFQTAVEEALRLKQLVDEMDARKADRSLHTTNERPEAIRDEHGALVSPMTCTEWPAEA